jgi:hypothetical protein
MGMLVGVAGRRPVQKFGVPPSSGRRVSHTPGSTFSMRSASMRQRACASGVSSDAS